jgi:DNA-directed RNA polymerase subunit B'
MEGQAKEEIDLPGVTAPQPGTVQDQFIREGVLPERIELVTEQVDDVDPTADQVPGEIILTEDGKLLKHYLSYRKFTSFLIEIYDDWIRNRLGNQIAARYLTFPDHTVAVFQNIIAWPPQYTQNKQAYQLTPMKARLDHLTYGMELYATLVQKRSITDADPIKVHPTPVYLGKIPVMLGSEFCYLRGKSPAELAELGEDPNDPRGYFVVGGSEKLVLLQELLRVNKIFMMPQTTKGKPICRITVPTMRGTAIVDVVMGKKNNLRLRLPSLKKNTKGQPRGINILRIYRLYGRSVSEAKALIRLFLRPASADRALLALTPTEPDIEVVLDDEAYMARKMIGTAQRESGARKMKKQLPTLNEAERQTTREWIARIFQEDFFPHINNYPPEYKLFMLSIMVSRMLEQMAGVRKLDDRDSWSNKRLESAGRMMEQLFRGLWRLALQPIQKMLESGSIQDLSGIAGKLRHSEVTEGFENSFTTANWGVKGVTPKPNVAQTVKRDNMVDTLSHLLRIDVNVNRTDKQPSIRLVQMTQYGYVCSGSSSEGETCLPVSALVVLGDGNRCSIGSLSDGDVVLTVNPTTFEVSESPIFNHFIKRNRDYGASIIRLTLLNGRSIPLTQDHPVLTGQGFKRADQLMVNQDSVCVQYVPTAYPHHVAIPEFIMTEAIFRERFGAVGFNENLTENYVRDLAPRNLLNIVNNDPRLPVLARMAGFLLTDGWLGFNNAWPRFRVYMGCKEDSELFQADIRGLGFTAEIAAYNEFEMTSDYDGKDFTHHIWSTGHSGPLAALFMTLGLMYGRKTTQAHSPVPSWVMNGSQLVKREFLAGLCGGDGGSILAKSNAKNARSPMTAYSIGIGFFTQRTLTIHHESMMNFLNQVRDLLLEFEVEVAGINVHNQTETMTDTYLRFSNSGENIVRFMDRIGYRYSSFKTSKSFKVSEYIRYKNNIVQERTRLKLFVLGHYNQGMKPKEISDKFNLDYWIVKNITAVKGGNSYKTSAPKGTIPYAVWDQMVYTKGTCVFIPLQFVSQEPDDLVADFTTVAETHTFVHDSGIVTHNCGILKNLSISARTSIDSDDIIIINTLRGATGGHRFLFEQPIPAVAETATIINGKFLGWCPGEETRAFSIRMRREGAFPRDCCIIVDRTGFLYINSDSSRVIRPLLIVDPDGELVIDKKKLRGAHIPIETLFSQGAMEYIDAWEQEYIMLATSKASIAERRAALHRAIDDYGYALADMERVERVYGVMTPEHITRLHEQFSAIERAIRQTRAQIREERTTLNQLIVGLAQGPQYQIDRGEVPVSDEHIAEQREKISRLNQHEANLENELEQGELALIVPAPGYEAVATLPEGVTAPAQERVMIRVPLTLEQAQQRVIQTRNLRERLESKRPYTHCEIDPQALYSESVTLTPGPQHMMAPRITYQTNMIRQALGTYHSNHMNRFDGKTKLMAFPNRPLFETQQAEMMGLDRSPQSVNVILAFANFTGYTVEDAFVFNKASVDAGVFDMYKYMVYSETVKVAAGERPARPQIRAGDNPEYYRAINTNGLPTIGVELFQGDCVIGKVRINPNTGEEENASLYLKTGDEGRVDSVHVTSDDKTLTIEVKLRILRLPIIGDKFAARYAQKGTIGLIVPATDMPMTQDGTYIDVLVNPHAISSRMTVIYLIELLAGKHAILRGERVNASPFKEFDIDEFRETLRQYGFQERGLETLYSGTEGVPIEAQIYVGVVAFQALRHHAADKYQSRGQIGGIKIINRQPTRGRAQGGGLRFGEMEHWATQSHGAAATLRERLCTLSDPYTAVFCKTCGTLALRDKIDRNRRYRCRRCGTVGSFGRVQIPYSWLLLTRRLAIGGINVTLDMVSREEYEQQKVDQAQEAADRYGEDIEAEIEEEAEAAEAEEEDEDLGGYLDEEF